MTIVDAARIEVIPGDMVIGVDGTDSHCIKILEPARITGGGGSHFVVECHQPQRRIVKHLEVPIEEGLDRFPSEKALNRTN